MEARVLLDTDLLDITITRLCYELIENYGDFSNSAIIGVQPRGAVFAEYLHSKLKTLTNIPITFGKIDPTFHRDDFRRGDDILQAKTTEMDFAVEGKKILLVDDVLFTGRTIRSAMDALISFGRPSKVELLALIDRRFNRELPIQADYLGITVDTVEPVKVKVEWENDADVTKNIVWILKDK
ncbi:MAG: bifunctional pyr operon transcriptional regulator/uracil phosphoribosyltransferase PyrR [Chitinophagales bacterium]|nr:bifunctional pyr operon transcriptional regulator/uracil phosphoribosyltransferase PyrR [Chitinophagales bacterium]